MHPLRLQAEVELDRRAPLDNLEYGHGTWDGRWASLCERDWELMRGWVLNSLVVQQMVVLML